MSELDHLSDEDIKYGLPSDVESSMLDYFKKHEDQRTVSFDEMISELDHSEKDIRRIIEVGAYEWELSMYSDSEQVINPFN